jgi:hypothetical protein
MDQTVQMDQMIQTAEEVIISILIHMIHIPQIIHPTVEVEMIQSATQNIKSVTLATQNMKSAHPTVVEATPEVTLATQNMKSAHPMVEEATQVEEDPAPIPQLTGLLEVKLPQSRTKVNAVPAGLSLPLETSLPEELSTTTPHQLITPSNNSSIAPLPTMVAVVVSWTQLSNTLKPHHSRPHPTIHIKVKKDTADTPKAKDKVPFLATVTFNTEVLLPLKKLSRVDQFLLPSMLLKLLSNLTLVVSLPLVADLLLITVLWLSVGTLMSQPDKNTSSSKINGVQAGEMVVTSRLVPSPPALAVFLTSHPSLLSIDQLRTSSSNYVYILLVFILK